VPIRAAIAPPGTAERREQQLVSWTASSRSTSRQISRATLKIPKSKDDRQVLGSGWSVGEVLRGTHGLTPDKVEGYLKMRVAEYSKGFKWLPKDSHLQWLKKDIVTIDGRKWRTGALSQC